MEVKGDRRVGKNDFAVIEVVEEEEEDSVGVRNLLGEEFASSKWKGSTRLLLLDERFAGRGMKELLMGEMAKTNIITWQRVITQRKFNPPSCENLRGSTKQIEQK
ncbi:hypothetical protein V8G54_013223 [Vigna mungo]|uniref:Uncharacterized protein n=1 Tax=Vigna mungo TaxID=3915 RepID=A0AAQ3NVA0_VIGMU